MDVRTEPAEQPEPTGQPGPMGQSGQPAYQTEPDGRARPGDETYRRQLEEIQKIDFVLVELNLYLDTHPADMQALQQYNQMAQRRRQLCYDFEMRFGPLMHFGQNYSRFPWQWVETPWPWQV